MSLPSISSHGDFFKSQRTLKIHNLFSHSSELTQVDTGVPSLNILCVFLFLFITQNIQQEHSAT